MATTLEQQPQIRFDLGGAVQGRLDAFVKARALSQTNDEVEFLNNQSKGMSAADQLDFRKSQLEREKNRPVPDQDYIKSVEKEVAHLTLMARYDKVRKAYSASLQDVNSGNESWQQHLTFLEQQLADNPDPDMQSEIQREIETAKKNIFDNNVALLENEKLIAISDKSLPLIDKAIADISTEKAKALGAGDPTRASMLDLKIQALNQNKVDIQIDNENNQLSSSRARKASAVGYLQSIQDRLDKADSSTPIIYKGVRYDSEQQYWQITQNKYIETNFFNDLDSEYTKFIKSVSDVNGLVPNSVMDSIQSDFQQLSSNPVMQPYLNRLNVLQGSTLASAVEKTAAAIRNRYDTDSDFQGAINDLSSLQQKYGIDVTADVNNVVQKEATIKGQDFANILGAVQQYASQFGVSYAEAAKQVMNNMGTKGSKAIQDPRLSPKELATTPTNKLVENAPAETDKNINKPALTVPGSQADINKPANVKTPAQAVGLTNPPAAAAGTATEQPTPIFNPGDHVGTRVSAVDNKTTEYYNKQSGQGYSSKKALYGDFIGKRQSTVNPSVTEYYNKKNNQGFGNEGEVTKFATSLGAGQINNLGELGI